MTLEANPLDFARDLIRCPSVTPEEGGALSYLQDKLERAGFSCHRLPFSQDGTPDVDNLYARLGTSEPHICFAGHTDVVPPGNVDQWRFEPFNAHVEEGILFGRGAADMKGCIASFLSACLRIIQVHDGLPHGSISFLITGDEEGPAINGTVKMLKWLEAKGELPDYCLVGEPTNPNAVGDEIKVGRRGSLNGVLTVYGHQGHVAYQELANNPITGLVSVLESFNAEPLDHGNDYFAPSNLEVTSIDVGNQAVNVIPATARAQFNIRFNNLQTARDLEHLLRRKAVLVLDRYGLDHDFEFVSSGEAFMTDKSPLIDHMVDAVTAVTGRVPRLTTSGGTSDARFIKDYCPVIEFGLVNATIHKIDEHVPVDDLLTLANIYEKFLSTALSSLR